MFQTPAYIFKRMVYSFYVTNTVGGIFLNEIHFEMLKKYINIFNEVIFCIIIDDITDISKIKEIEKRVMSFRNGDIQFKIYENSNYRETEVFYNEIFLKMDELNGLTFYAHSKGQGVMNDMEETIFFIIAAYYFSLENIDNVNYYPFYGSFKMINNSPILTKGLKHMWFYVGTFLGEISGDI